jgi:hypothetical protein
MDAEEGRDPAAGGDAGVTGRLAAHMSERQRQGVTCSFGETAFSQRKLQLVISAFVAIVAQTHKYFFASSTYYALIYCT